MKRKIRRRCKCGCNRITNPGRRYINGHHRREMKHTEATKKKMSKAKKGTRLSIKTRKKLSLAKIKYDPNYEYCDIWKDKEYKNDIRKDYCENADCKNNYKLLDNHHIYLDKKRCSPNDIITLCHSCHAVLHRLLERGINKPANLLNYIIINKADHVSYIHKKSRKIIRIAKLKKREK